MFCFIKFFVRLLIEGTSLVNVLFIQFPPCCLKSQLWLFSFLVSKSWLNLCSNFLAGNEDSINTHPYNFVYISSSKWWSCVVDDIEIAIILQAQFLWFLTYFNYCFVNSYHLIFWYVASFQGSAFYLYIVVLSYIIIYCWF